LTLYGRITDLALAVHAAFVTPTAEYVPVKTTGSEAPCAPADDGKTAWNTTVSPAGTSKNAPEGISVAATVPSFALVIWMLVTGTFPALSSFLRRQNLNFTCQFLPRLESVGRSVQRGAQPSSVWVIAEVRNPTLSRNTAARPLHRPRLGCCTNRQRGKALPL